MRLSFRYRTAIFLGIIILLIVGRFYPKVAAWPIAASPFVGVASLIGSVTQKTFFTSPPFLIPALIVALPCLFRWRFLCHTICPMGFCFDVQGRAWKKLTGPNRLPKFLHGFPKLGVPLAIFTWLGVGFGVVGFLWLDPFVLFGSPFHWTSLEMPGDGDFRHQYVSPLFWLFLFLLLCLNPMAPTFWCRNICPLGGTQDLLHRPGSVPNKNRNPVDRKKRRSVLKHGISFLFFGGLFAYLFRHAGESSKRQRPPGAVDEATFLTLCTRCGACIRACPTQLLWEHAGGIHLQEEFCPMVFRVGNAWCRHDCNACGKVCPTGAIRKFTIEDKKHLKIGLAVLDDFEKCRLYEDIECAICRRDCPYDAVSYEWSDEEYRRIPMIDPEACTGCGRCAITCPGLGKNEPKPLKITSIFK